MCDALDMPSARESYIISNLADAKYIDLPAGLDIEQA